MFSFPPYDALQPGQLWLEPASVGGLLRIGMTDDARAILEVAAAEQGYDDLPSLIETDFHRLKRQWLASYRFGAPEGTWRGRFDDRQPGKKPGFLHCCFTDIDTGARHALTVFRSNQYRPRHGGPAFDREALTAQVFRLTTSRSKSGFANLIHAELDTGQAAGSWALAPESPAAAPVRPQTPQKTAILRAFVAASPAHHPPRP